MNVAADTRTTPLPDIQGSIVATLDSGNGALARAGFLPFGESAAATGTFRYTGRRIDPETGLYYYRARMYHPTWGRFLQPDPIGTAGGINLYAYVGNDPLNATDPSGKDPFIGATVGFIAGAYYGGLSSAIAPRVTWQSILAGAGVGGVIGLGVGALDPSLGIGTLTIIGSIAGGAGDVAGQIVTNALAGKSLTNINYGSTAGAVVGGAIGGAGGTLLGNLAARAGVSKLAGTAFGASISSGPGTFLPSIGASIYDYLNGSSEENIMTPINPKTSISNPTVPMNFLPPTSFGSGTTRPSK